MIVKGKENFLSTTDLTLTNPKSNERPFQVTITYTLNDSSLTNGTQTTAENNLRHTEDQMKLSEVQKTRWRMGK